MIDDIDESWFMMMIHDGDNDDGGGGGDVDDLWWLMTMAMMKVMAKMKFEQLLHECYMIGMGLLMLMVLFVEAC